MAATNTQPITNQAAVETLDVLKAEYRLIWGEEATGGMEDYHTAVLQRRQAALCLSGGGIRSAAFALGVLQALSEKRLLTGFHYLSTVSGGGYIGSWLQRWIHEHQGNAEEVMEALGGAEEPPQVSALRQNSNFITPRVGIGSNDTWTAVAMSLRNVSINWLLFGPLMMLVVLLPNLFLSGVDSVPRAVEGTRQFLHFLVFPGAACLAIATFYTVRTLPSYRKSQSLTPGTGDGWLTLRIVLPLVLWCVLGTLALSVDLLDNVTPRRDGLRLAMISLAGTLLGLLAGWVSLDRPHRQTLLSDNVVWPIAMVAAAAWIWQGAGLFNTFAPEQDETDWRAILLTTLGPLWLMASQLLASMVVAAFRKSEGGTAKPDADREWLARLSALKIKPMLLWAFAAFAALVLDQVLRRTLPNGDTSLSAIVALLTGTAAVAGGKSAKSGDVVKKAGAFLWKRLPMQSLVALATAVFVMVLFLLLARLESIMAASITLLIEPIRRPIWVDSEVVAHLLILLGLIALLLILRTRILVNRFSLNGLYRNRLARAFLGGARGSRAPDPFTGFDPKDNLRMHMLAPARNGSTVLYPVINVALNVTASENLAWQERKANSFIFSPKFSGSGMLRPEGTAANAPRCGSYVSSTVYGGSEPDLAMGSNSIGVTLATAMSISGAAASPNMGYHSSPATAFLMTLFNVRLGAWLPNPARAASLGEDIKRSGPNDSLRALLRELAGSTDDRGRDIYLSDGGHFENLGIYEMVRRRCRYIMVSDAGADPECAFEDLGNAVRKVKIDLGIDISFEELRISSRDKPINPQHAWAFGTIHYPEGKGRILYIKPSFFGELPVDVRSYAAGSESFPHESTGDQFFSESQFESYRRLGHFFTSALGKEIRQPASVRGFFNAVQAEHERQKANRAGGGADLQTSTLAFSKRCPP